MDGSRQPNGHFSEKGRSSFDCRFKISLIRAIFSACVVKVACHQYPRQQHGMIHGKTSSHFLKPLFAFLEVRAKSGLSHMMMVHTRATSLKPLFPLLCVDCRKGAQYILGTAPTFPTFMCGLQKGRTVHFRYCDHFSTFPP
jgi:hypothetical protein